MNQNKLFQRTRFRLALWYAIVMGLILTICSFGFYTAVSHAHSEALDRELEFVARSLHNNLESKLKQPEKVEPIVREVLPSICVVETGCISQKSTAQRHILNAIHQGYYVRLFGNSGDLIAIAGSLPQTESSDFNQKLWQTIQDDTGNFYHQMSLDLHTKDNRDWGYLQVGRNIADVNSYMDAVKLSLLVGLPIAMTMIAFASWWLAGLAMRPIYQSYRQIQQFTADAAHELRTPLAATQATIDSVLLMPDLDIKEAWDILGTIKRQNQRLISLVVDLLMLSRFDRESLSVQRELCSLNDIIEDLIEEFAAMAISSDVILKSEIRINKEINIIGNTEQLYRLFSNLIVNAIQYTLPGGEVTVILDSYETEAEIRVKDTGIGIPKNERSNVFDRFYRVNSDRSRHTGGSGLGLAIAKAIVVSHHGSLEVESEVGKGSTFIVTLPLLQSSRTKLIKRA
ncbi:histidine kinase [Rivularia sp. PCC 7116]|uniref:two-component system sensor histidine kinase RppB n=1 Tax=Rivularia sp. PCC 7116 TaxID=373994 RepID=UPI00029F45A7|nr:two-component system sensor histidine kinase RppB [Rivularia sp. PCC 7116]AFY54304.1 histidine kinase [Rivularia sp. PCC 7116]